jgi:hypothetical protein
MKKIAFIFLAALIPSLSVNAALITNFGTGSFTENPAFSNELSSYSQTATSSTAVIGWSGGLLAGTLSTPFDPAGFDSFSLSFTLNSAHSFVGTVFLLDSANTPETFTVDFSSAVVGQATTLVLSGPTTLSISSITQFGLQANAAPGNDLNITLTGLTAIPEPSTYAAILGGLALIFLVRRRMRKA